MNKSSVFFLAVALAIGPFAGCKKSNSSDSYTPSMTASINDSSFSAIGPSLAYSSRATASGFNLLYLYGEEAIGDLIQITLINNTGPGNFTFGSTNASAYYYPEGIANPYSQAVSGSINLTSTSPYITGTFTFITTTGLKVTNG